MIKTCIEAKLALSILLCILIINSRAEVFEIQNKSSDIIGSTKHIIAKPGDTLFSIGRDFDIGHVEMIEANPHIDPQNIIEYPLEIVIPSEFILPPGPRKGIVINLAELRLYYFHKNEPLVTSIPIGIGREGWNTPVGKTTIVEKTKNPKWFPTKNIIEDSKKEGIFLPKVIEPGPNNPLGKYSLRLGWTEYLMHGTNHPEGVGRRSSAGCIRMFPEDVEHLFNLANIGTSVRIINEPVKIGKIGYEIFIEAHAPLREDIDLSQDWVTIVNKVCEDTKKNIVINWSVMQNALNYHLGVPVLISRKLR
ncbi:MAG: L,D-transpeptidase family protein [Legionellales bacterium]|nr:L,D-transpeptidase family protein [Legionellales bacterium]